MTALPSGVPPAANALLVVVPELDPGFALAVDKSATSTQLAPFHSSVTAVNVAGGMSPPKAKLAVLVPDPLTPNLAVFKSPTSVQDDPFQVSVNAEIGGA